MTLQAWVGIASKRLGIACTTILLLANTALAEVDSNPPRVQSNADPPARVGNIYDHRAHQPTQSELQSRGIAPPSASSREQIDKEVEKLIQQASPSGSEAR